MVCCKVCSGWFHLVCMRMKQGTKLIKGKEFVCHLCVSSVVLRMREEIVEFKEGIEGGVKQNGESRAPESNVAITACK